MTEFKIAASPVAYQIVPTGTVIVKDQNSYHAFVL